MPPLPCKGVGHQEGRRTGRLDVPDAAGIASADVCRRMLTHMSGAALEGRGTTGLDVPDAAGIFVDGAIRREVGHACSPEHRITSSLNL